MSPVDGSPSAPEYSGPPDPSELLNRTRDAEAELLARAREVAQKINERVRKVLGDAAPDQPASPAEPTEGGPPV